MNYEKFIADYEAERIDEIHQKLYEFACLKVARHDLNHLILENDFDSKTENKLKNILNKLNKIHGSNAHLESEFKDYLC